MFKDKVYSLNDGYSPYICQTKHGLAYCFTVSSGHVDMEFTFNISDDDLKIFRLNDLKFKALYFLLFYQVQGTFGTGHSKPRKYTIEEFEIIKNKVLTKSNANLKLYLKTFSKQKNLSATHFEAFCKNVFGKET